MAKEDVVYVYNEILVSHKKEWNFAICNNTDGLTDYHTKWSQTKTNAIWYHLYVESKVGYKWVYSQAINRLTLKINLQLLKGKSRRVG